MSTRTRGEVINTWVQTIAILFAGLWALYTFVYKEVYLPRLAEGSLDVSLDMSVAGSSPTYTAVAMTVTVKNPSSRRVYLLPSAFFVWGSRYGQQEASDDEFCKKTQKSLRGSSDAVLNRYAKTESQSIVASGKVLHNYYFSPSESAAQTVIFHVPRGAFDVVDAYVLLPQAYSTENLRAEWVVNKGSRRMDLYEREVEKGEWVKVDKNDTAFRTRTGYGTSTAHKMLCLWSSADTAESFRITEGVSPDDSDS